jgi:hypothetical protein
MNRSKTYIGIAAAFAALAALAHFTAKPLLAQVKAALIQNVDEPARNPFSEDFLVGATAPGCTSGRCDLDGNFVVPAGKRLVITNITGQVLTSNGPFARASLSTTTKIGVGGGLKFLATEGLPSTVAFMGGGLYSINFNLQLQSYFEAGQSIELSLLNDGILDDDANTIRV